jgi:hypothetical protein
MTVENIGFMEWKGVARKQKSDISDNLQIELLKHRETN